MTSDINEWCAIQPQWKLAQTFFSTFRTNGHRPQFCEPGCLPTLKPCPTGEQCIPLNSGKTG